MRRLPQEFVSLSEVVERLELAGFSTDRAHRVVRDIRRDRRYLKRLSWADTTMGAIIDIQDVHVVPAPSDDEIDWKTSTYKNQLLDARGRRLAKIEVLLADLRWYLKEGAELSPDPAGPVRASLAAEKAAIKALASHLKSHRDLTRADATKWLIDHGFAENRRGFQHRVWPEARRLAGLMPLAPPGAKKKSSRSP